MIHQHGFIALVVVVVIGAAALVMSLNASLLGLGGLETGVTADAGGAAAALTDGCLEEGLRRLILNPAFPGVTLPSFLGASCIIEVTAPSPEARLLAATVARGNYEQTITATVALENNHVVAISF